MSIKILGEVNVPKNGYRELQLYADGQRWQVLTDGAVIEGYWVEESTSKWIEDKYTRKCSKCESSYWKRGVDAWKYCPNCGSRMETEDE